MAFDGKKSTHVGSQKSNSKYEQNESLLWILWSIACWEKNPNKIELYLPVNVCMYICMFACTSKQMICPYFPDHLAMSYSTCIHLGFFDVFHFLNHWRLTHSLGIWYQNHFLVILHICPVSDKENSGFRSQSLEARIKKEWGVTSDTSTTGVGSSSGSGSGPPSVSRRASIASSLISCILRKRANHFVISLNWHGFYLTYSYTVYEENSQHQTGHFHLGLPNFLNTKLPDRISPALVRHGVFLIQRREIKESKKGPQNPQCQNVS